jgi:peptide chain release factor 2
LNTWENVFDIREKELRIRELAKESLREGFWNDQNKAKEILQEQSHLNDAVANWKKLVSNVDDLDLLYQIASEEHTSELQSLS